MQYHEPPGRASGASLHRFWLVTLAVVATLALTAGVVVGKADLGSSSPTHSLLPASAKVELFNEAIVENLYADSIPAVVKLETSQVTAGVRASGQGSGFLIDDQGHILTNNHVISSATRVTIVLQDGTRISGEVLGRDTSADLALVKADPARLRGITPLPLADSDQVKPGQMAVALGSPYGLQGTVTVGIVSGVHRNVGRTLTDAIQTDAAIFPGNSGGPLLNSKGEVIGINTAVATAGSDTAGLGFAVPINKAKNQLPALSAGATFSRPWIGVSLVSVGSPDIDANLGVNNGAYIVQVVQDSPAQRAGLRAPTTQTNGDVIIEVDGRTVTGVDSLITYVAGKKPGDVIALKLWRDGQQVTVQVTLGTWPEQFS